MKPNWIRSFSLICRGSYASHVQFDEESEENTKAKEVEYEVPATDHEVWFLVSCRIGHLLIIRIKIFILFIIVLL